MIKKQHQHHQHHQHQQLSIFPIQTLKHENILPYKFEDKLPPNYSQ